MADSSSRQPKAAPVAPPASAFAAVAGMNQPKKRRVVPPRPWDEYFVALQDFHREHGHCNVPITYKDNRLAKWVVRQRNSRKGLTAERLAKLNSVDLLGETRDERLERQWDEMFQRLKKHIRERLGQSSMQEFGFFNDDKKLNIWVSHQRMLHRKNIMRVDRRERLEAIGFIWVVNEQAFGRKNTDWKIYADIWEAHFEKLTLFKEKHGHTLVPNRHPDKAFYCWVASMRAEYKFGTIPQYRKDRLNSIGFVWNATNHNDADSSIKQREWNAMYDRLVAFHTIHGHTRCRKQDDKELANWVLNQRKRYESMDEGRAKRLDALNFSVNTHKTQWNNKFEELVQYKQQHGHCLVPQHHGSLGQWVAYLRTRKRSTSLPPDRIKKLEQLGFVWEVPKGHTRRTSLVSTYSSNVSAGAPQHSKHSNRNRGQQKENQGPRTANDIRPTSKKHIRKSLAVPNKESGRASQPQPMKPLGENQARKRDAPSQSSGEPSVLSGDPSTNCFRIPKKKKRTENNLHN